MLDREQVSKDNNGGRLS